MVTSEWLMVGVVIAGQIGTLLLAADKWVHHQGAHVETLQGKTLSLELMAAGYQARIALIELEQARINEHLKATDRDVTQALQNLQYLQRRLARE